MDDNDALGWLRTHRIKTASITELSELRVEDLDEMLKAAQSMPEGPARTSQIGVVLQMKQNEAMVQTTNNLSEVLAAVQTAVVGLADRVAALERGE